MELFRRRSSWTWLGCRWINDRPVRFFSEVIFLEVQVRNQSWHFVGIIRVEIVCRLATFLLILKLPFSFPYYFSSPFSLFDFQKASTNPDVDVRVGKRERILGRSFEKFSPKIRVHVSVYQKGNFRFPAVGKARGACPLAATRNKGIQTDTRIARNGCFQSIALFFLSPHPRSLRPLFQFFRLRFYPLTPSPNPRSPESVAVFFFFFYTDSFYFNCSPLCLPPLLLPLTSPIDSISSSFPFFVRSFFFFFSPPSTPISLHSFL